MKSKCTKRFWELYEALPHEVKRLAVKNYQLWVADPFHPSLQFRKLGGKDLHSIRIGDHYRALCYFKSGVATWVWIGSHGDYDKLTSQS